MSIKAKYADVWREPAATALKAKYANEWRAGDGWVKDGGIWKQFHVKSDPITYIVWFGPSGWSQVYRGVSGVTSNRTNGDDLCYWGHSWNNEIERSMVAMDDKVDAAAAASLRPVVQSAVVKTWVGHVYAGTDNVYLGIAGAATKPSTFERLHSEKDSGYGQLVTLTKPGSGAGALDTQTMTTSVAQNWWDAMAASLVGSLTFSAEDATDPNNLWGWSTGRQYSTGNSGGSASGITDLPPGDNRATRVEFTVDYA